MKNQPPSPITPMKNNKKLGKRLSKFLKQQELLDEKKDFLPGKLTVTTTQRCKAKVVNFFGDVHTEVFSLDVNCDEELVGGGCSNGDIKIYNIYEGRLLMMGNTSHKSGYPNTGIRWNPKKRNEIAACNCDGSIKWYNTDKEMTVAHVESEIGYLCCDYGCDGSWSAFGTQKHTVQVYDGETKKFMQKYKAGTLDEVDPNHTSRIFSLKSIKNQPNLFFTGGWDSTVRLWDIRIKDNYVRKFSGPSISADSLDLKGNTLLVGNYANKDPVQLWDFSTGKVMEVMDIKEQSPGSSYCFAAAFAHKSKYDLCATAMSGVNKVKIFEKKQIVSELNFQAVPLCLTFYQSKGKDFMMAGGIQGTIYVIKINILD